MSARTAAVPIGACLAALVLAACGPGQSATDGKGRAASAGDSYADKTPEEIRQLAYDTTRTADFKKVRARLEGDGVTRSLDFSFARVDCAGTFSGEGLGRTEIHATPEVVHAKLDAEAWRASLTGPKAQEDAAVERAAGRWIRLTADQAEAKGIGQECRFSDPTMLLEEQDPQITRGASATVDGQPAVTLTHRAAGGGTVTDYVAAQGRPYLLKRTQTGRLRSEITYYDFETVTQLRPPADSETVTAEGL
ncbi:hypothetical protein ACFW6F_36020 [Streptomyces sp. NPDC058746]|uniref:hypothetical protein n=1 Tax=Streptomyces sp. NPDC058746 TaxID=3346622 RepID=UPI0036B31FCF